MDAVTQNKRRARPAADRSEAASASFIRWLASPLHLILLLLTLVPPVVTLVYVLRNGLDVPVVDQWNNSVPIALKAATGTLQVSDLFRQLNEHRFFFTHLITAILTVTTRWNLRVEMMVIFAIACANLLLAAILLWRSDRRAFAFGIVPISALLFSLRQHTSWLLSIQTSWHLIIFWFLLLLYVARFSRVGWRALAICALLGLCMTFTTLHGLLIWPLMLVGFWLLGYRKPGYLGFWLIAAAVSIGLFFYQYNFSIMGADRGGQSAGIVTDPLKILAYAITYLGNPFVLTGGEWALPAALIGASGLIVGSANLIYLVRRDHSWRGVVIWLVMAGFSVGAALLTALGRSHIFLEYPAQPLLDRYVTPSLLLWIAFVALMAQVVWPILSGARTGQWETVLAPLNPIVFILVGAFFLYSNADSALLPGLMTPQQAACVEGFPVSRNARCLSRIYLKETPLTEVIDAADQLSTHRLALFADTAPPYDDVIALYNLGPKMDSSGAGFLLSVLSDRAAARVLKLPAPGQVEVPVTIPQTNQPVQLVTTALLMPDRPPQATIFRVGARFLDGSTKLLLEFTYDTRADADGHPIHLLLDAYRGQTIRLIFQTRGANGQAVPNAVWIDPLVAVIH